MSLPRHLRALLAAALLALLLSGQPNSTAAKVFEIQNDAFVRDGEKTQILAMCIHYARVRPELWADRLERIAALGANAIQTYVPWNWHNAEEGTFNFTGDRDLVQFITLAQKAGLMVLVRSGPYMCGEWEFGGFPAWLLTKNATLRTYEPNYIAAVDVWMKKLYSLLQPVLYENGGPVVMVQVENEFGSYGDVSTNPKDLKYMQHLVQLARSVLGPKVILYTTDGGNTGYMTRGSLKGDAVYTVGDFGPTPNFAPAFAAQKAFNAPGKSPNMCSEYYSGWLTHWGEHMANTSSANLAKDMDAMLQTGASMSMYMGYGGTNFGFFSGANGGGGTSYQPHITSYDYDSPISSGGEHGFGSDGVDKYVAVQSVLKKYPQPQGPNTTEPAAPATTAYLTVVFKETADLLDSLGALCSWHNGSQLQPSSEFYGHNYGFTLYSTIMAAGGASVAIEAARDRAQVFVDGVFQGVVYRTAPAPVSVTASKGSRLTILVENMGRINFGHGLTDPKGIVGTVSVDGKVLAGGWDVCAMPLKDGQASKLQYSAAAPAKKFRPAFYRATLEVAQAPVDTYVASHGWTKGYVWVNGFNLGRYWEPQGPQRALYLPAPLLRQGANELVLLELDAPAASLALGFLSAPDFNFSVPCDAAATVSAGAGVFMWSAAAGLGANQHWTFSGKGPIALASNPGLCLDGATLRLATCIPGAAHQQFVLDAATEEIRTSSGTCLDVFSHESNDGAALDDYACNGGQNQQWAVRDGAIVSAQAGPTAAPFAVTACARA